MRRLADLEEVPAPAGFVRIHRSYLVNPERLPELRRRDDARSYEVVLEPPQRAPTPVRGLVRRTGVAGVFFVPRRR